MSSITHEKLKVTSPIADFTVSGLSMSQQPGEHGILVLSGVAENGVSLSEIDAMSGQPLRVAYTDDSGKEVRRPIFAGVIIGVQVDHINTLCQVTIEACTASVALDDVPKSRSFQDAKMTYLDVVDAVLSDTPGANAVLSVGRDVAIGKPLIHPSGTTDVAQEPQIKDAIPGDRLGIPKARSAT